MKSNRYFYGIITIFIILGVFLIAINHYSTKALTGTRGYISGEGHWTKAQKTAVLNLIRYINLQDEWHYERFNNSLRIVDGYKQARLTLSSDEPDYETAYTGFLQGNLQPKEIESMIWLFNNFQNMQYLENAIMIWEKGDEKIEELTIFGAEIYNLISQQQFSDDEAARYINSLYQLDDELSLLQDEFSIKMTEASIFIDSIFYWSILILGLILIAIGALTTIQFFRMFNHYHNRLHATELKYKNILANSQDVIYLMDTEGTKYEYISPSAEKMLGYTADELMKGGTSTILHLIHPDDAERIKKERDSFATSELEKQLEHDTEFRIKTKSGKYVWVNNKRSLLKDETGSPIGIIGNVRDITRKKKDLEKINHSLREKETLLTEIHHRVKNNLAIISGLIELQKVGVNDKKNVIDVMEEIQSRIQSIVLVHEKLYQSEELSQISLKDYIEELTGYIGKIIGNEKREIQIEKILDDVKLDIVHAIPFGLVYNELIANIYKHAFNGSTKQCKVKIQLTSNHDNVTLIVADNGVGFSDHFDLKKSESLGITLIRELTQQINGRVEFSDDDWTKFVVTFKNPGNVSDVVN